MPNGFFSVPNAGNEPVLSYAPGTPERLLLKEALALAKAEVRDLPMIIGGKQVFTGDKVRIAPPHELSHTLGYYHKGGAAEVEHAVEAALQARHAWLTLSWEQRASVFLKAAELLAGPYRARMNAATMLGQSKNVFQAEIDSACELIDFFRFNVDYLTQVYRSQPRSAPGIWNRTEWRPLEGFVFALTPFNFTSIAGNLPTAPALMGNTVVWKPSATQIYSAHVIMEILLEAGLPDGVINIVYTGGKTAADVVFSHPWFAGFHFTGSTEVFNGIWQTIGQNVGKYRSYPRIVGETGGKDFIVAHASADIDALATALTRGAFEYQGQKCSAASRAYIPRSIWPRLRDRLVADLESVKMGSPEDFTNFVNAVIDEGAFDRITSYIERVRQHAEVEILAGGTFSKTEGYYIAPTILVTTNPHYITMEEELFGPVLTLYVYDDAHYEETLALVDNTSVYGLTGAVFATDRHAIEIATTRLMYSAGNFYINDKPTGAVVGQQPFGGSRRSGTNDKAGSILDLLRWVSPRSIKETFIPAKDYRYPFMSRQ